MARRLYHINSFPQFQGVELVAFRNSSAARMAVPGKTSIIRILKSKWGSVAQDVGHLKRVILLSLQCLCLSPTYELALQTGKVIEQMGKFYPELKLAYAVRGNKCE